MALPQELQWSLSLFKLEITRAAVKRSKSYQPPLESDYETQQIHERTLKETVLSLRPSIFAIRKRPHCQYAAIPSLQIAIN
jgi:hypothetical protein